MPLSPQILAVIDSFSKVITPIIAFLALWIALREAHTSRTKLRLELYNRRFAIYSRTIDYFHALALYDASPPLQADLLRLRKEFLKCIEESRFLFEKDSGIFELLLEMYKKSFERTGPKEISKILAEAGAYEEVVAGFAKSEGTLQWLAEAIPRLAKVMEPYLNFHKLAG